MSANDQTLKAFVCCCEGECGAAVVFAADRNEARQKDRRDCECDFVDKRYRRASNFDDLAPGPVTQRDYLDRGWLFEYQKCGHNVDRHTEGRAVGAANVFCSAKCFEQFKATAQEIVAMPGHSQHWVDTLRELDDVQVIHNAEGVAEGVHCGK